MNDSSIAHDELIDSPLDPADRRRAGEGTHIYHERDLQEMDSAHDGRLKTVLVNESIVPSSGGVLIDVITYGPGVSCPVHYHEGTRHFFYVLEGSGILEVEGEEFELERGSLAWIGEGDRHRLYAREGQKMKLFEYFSNGDHKSEFFGEECTWQPDSVGPEG